MCNGIMRSTGAHPLGTYFQEIAFFKFKKISKFVLENFTAKESKNHKIVDISKTRGFQKTIYFVQNDSPTVHIVASNQRVVSSIFYKYQFSKTCLMGLDYLK